jgi:ABC-type branched-subunit amino acid transport system ATPase component
VGIERHAGVLAGSLSYGQRKLLELAYVLVADPAVILLDEPAGGVNPTLINLIADRIRLLNTEQGKTFLLVEHNMEFVMGLCSTITVLESGADVVSGPPDIVRTDKRVLDAYLGADLDDADLEEATAFNEVEGRMSELASELVSTVRPRMRTPSASEVAV